MGDQMQDQEFEKFLRSRSVPKVSQELSERIIASARGMSQQLDAPSDNVVSFAGFKRALGNVFSPQVALAASVVLVFALGTIFVVTQFEDTQNESVYYAASEDVELAFYLDDIVEVD